MKWFNQLLNGLAEAVAPLLPASTEGVGEAEAPKPPAKPAGITAVSTTASTTKPAGIAYAAVFVGRISKAVTNTELQETFRTDAVVGRYYRKRNRGFAKILVPDHELDRALSQNSSSHDHKFHGVAKWHDAKAPSSRAYRSAQVSATSVGCRKMSSATIASGAEFFMREKWKQMASKGPSRSHAQDCNLFVVSDIRM